MNQLKGISYKKTKRGYFGGEVGIRRKPNSTITLHCKKEENYR